MDRADLSSARYEAREFGETPRNLRKERQELPEPHPNLTREEAVVFRQLQTEHMVTPVMGKHIMPEVYKDDSCKLRRSTRATLYHIAWDCTRRPTEASREKCLPPEIKTAIQAEDYDQQIQHISDHNKNERGSRWLNALAVVAIGKATSVYSLLRAHLGGASSREDPKGREALGLFRLWSQLPAFDTVHAQSKRDDHALEAGDMRDHGLLRIATRSRRRNGRGGAAGNGREDRWMDGSIRLSPLDRAVAYAT
ncbi:hypothetical protein HPB47_024187 [Ixodes persulcatus]|uniref:Uncharacterized protein n=1 Tax=Ixodes persulcatus TaxID=34615 RepID=A0AC60Q6X4_IXOPE|nr:hypothetical protein HPB47_024187 [Ixodes persulcatus]